MSKNPISILNRRCQLYGLQLKDRYESVNLLWKCVLEVTQRGNFVISSTALGHSKKIAKTLACREIINNSKLNSDYPDKQVSKDAVSDDYTQNNYILFGRKFLREHNYKISHNIDDLNQLRNKFVAIDTEGREQYIQRPIIIQIADEHLCVILRYDEYELEIRGFLNTKKVFVFGGANEFRIMGFTPPRYIEVQSSNSQSLKDMASDYHCVTERFLKPNKYFYENVNWQDPSKEHIIYAAFDALNTYILGINMVNQRRSQSQKH